MAPKKIVMCQDKQLLALLSEDSFFQREHFTIVPVKDHQSGYEVVEVEAPALAVLSLETMGEKALESCRQIKADRLLGKTAVLLLLPQNADDDLAEACWASGCDALLHSPLTSGRLLDAACGLLGIDRRIVPRWPVCFKVKVTADDETFSATALNLTDKGMFLTTEQLSPVDTKILLEFSPPDFHEPIICLARVAWVNHPEWRKKVTLPCGIGVEFINLNANAKETLAEFIISLTGSK